MRNKNFASFGIRQTLFLFIVLLLPLFTIAQKKTPLIERTISVRINNLKMDAALGLIAQQGGFTFSYNPSLIDINRSVNLTITKKTIREVLNIMFNEKITAKEKGNYLILIKEKEQTKKTKTKNETFVVSGYVFNEAGEKLPWASVYNKVSLASAVSDNYGFYILELPNTLKDLSLNVSKKEYLDTVVQLKENNSQFLNITLGSLKKEKTYELNIDSLSTLATETAKSFFMSEASFANATNIKDTLYKKTQVSFIPFLGSNGKLSGNVINDYSFNLLGGYALGTRKLELAGIFNTDRGNVQYCQLAGFANAVGGNIKGCQLSGFVNTVRKKVQGVQGAGFANFAWGGVEGVQLAGFVNATNTKSSCVQAAGFVNGTLDTAKGVQAAGLLNVAVGDYTGVQIAGFVNVALNKIEGMQIGCFNFANQLKGTQLGLFNSSKTCNGVPIGLLSYVNNGYHKIEVSADEIFYTNIAFRSGLNSFHNIITAGINPGNLNTPLWTFGYGVGSTIMVGKKQHVGIDIDLTSNQIVKQTNFEKINLNNKGYVGLDIKLYKKMSLAFGVTVNGQLTDSDYQLYPDIFRGIAPNIFYNTTYESSNLYLRMWLGGKVALRFL